MGKAAPSTQLRERIAAFLRDAGSIESGAAALSGLVGLATRRVVQEALEQEQTDLVGRERYERAPGRGKRNGYVPGHLDTAEGRLPVQVPQVGDAVSLGALRLPPRPLGCRRAAGGRDVGPGLVDPRRGGGVHRRARRVPALEERGERADRRAVDGVRGLPSAAARRRPDLRRVLGRVYEPLRSHGIEREAILVAWGITLDGKKILLSRALGNRESHEAWRDCLRDLVARGLPRTVKQAADTPASGRKFVVANEPAMCTLLSPGMPVIPAQLETRLAGNPWQGS